MLESYHGPLFNLLYPIQVNFFSPKEAEALIRNPVRGVVDYDDLAVEELIRTTNGHPRLLQLLCFDLMKHLAKEKRDTITLLDVNRVIAEQSRQGYDHSVFSEIFNNLGLSDSQKLILALTAETTERANSCCSQKKIHERLADSECPIPESELASDLVKLVRMGLVWQELRPDQSFEYRVNIPLFANWLRVYQKVADLAGKLRKSLPTADLGLEELEHYDEPPEGEPT